MTRIKMKVISLVLLSLGITIAVARDGDGRDGCRDARWCVAAPEIDPAQGMSALALLAGAAAILRARRGGKK